MSLVFKKQWEGTENDVMSLYSPESCSYHPYKRLCRRISPLPALPSSFPPSFLPSLLTWNSLISNGTTSSSNAGSRCRTSSCTYNLCTLCIKRCQ